MSQQAFPTGVKDVDIQILLTLPDNDLNNACQTNVYVRQICNEDRLWILKIEQRFPQIKIYKPYNISWREFYNNANDGYNVEEGRFYTLKEAIRNKRIKSYDILLEVNNEKLDQSYLNEVLDLDTFKWLTSKGIIPTFREVLFPGYSERLMEQSIRWMVDGLNIVPTQHEVSLMLQRSLRISSVDDDLAELHIYPVESYNYLFAELYLYLTEKFNYPLGDLDIKILFNADYVDSVKLLIRRNIISQKHIDIAVEKCALNVLKYIYEQTGELPEFYPSSLTSKCTRTRDWIFEARINKGLYKMPDRVESGSISTDELNRFKREFQGFLDYKGINRRVITTAAPVVQVASNDRRSRMYAVESSEFGTIFLASPVVSPVASPVALPFVQYQPTVTYAAASPAPTQYQPTFTPAVASPAPTQYQPTYTPAVASPVPTQYQPTYTPAVASPAPTQYQPTYNPASAQFQPIYTPSPVPQQPMPQQQQQAPSGTVRNPETGRMIQVGKTTYNNLLKKGYVYVNGQLIKR